MAPALKTVNAPALYGLMLMNLAVLYAFVTGESVPARGVIALVTDLDKLIPAGIGLALVGILNAQISAEAKARIIFLRWRHPLPGCRAFSLHAASDARVDVAELSRQYGNLPYEPREQNALWYRLYKGVDCEPAVTQVHRSFLFARDYACVALMMLFVLGGYAMLYVPSKSGRVIFVGVLLVQFLLAMRAARNHGIRFVTTVLAIAAAKPQLGK